MKLMKEYMIEIIAFLIMIAPPLINAEDGGSGPDLKKTIFSWKKTDDAIALLNDKVVWQFNYGPDKTKPYFHPISLLDGTVLTWEAPPDHPWHHALWFSWKFINGVNYWEENRKTKKSAGTTSWSDVKISTRPNHSALISLTLNYHLPGQASLLKEERKIEISAPNPAGEYQINWISSFVAKADVVLDRTPLPGEPKGKAFGGYAGLSVRLRKGIKEGHFTGSQGVVKLKEGRLRVKDKVMEYSGVVDSREFGIAILGHPGNLNAPTPWYLIQNSKMEYFSPAVICYGPRRMSAGDSFTLKYCILVHQERWNSERLKNEYEKFAGISQ